MDLGLKNKKALVTGASRGLGFATALALSGEGAQVAINARDAVRLQKAAGEIMRQTDGKIFALPGDLALPDLASSLPLLAAEKLGGLDILVVNSGGPPPGRFEEFDDDAWQKAINGLLMSAVRLIRAALPSLRASDSPSVLTVTSYSIKQPIPNLVLSNSIRAAVAGLTKTLALELGPEGIRVNSILPAWTETERVQELITDRARRSGATPEEETRKQAAESALGRMSKPEEFARAAAFLCSPAASYLTGVMLPVDGGMYKGTF
jgi:3-oxoacyl-[acyl-carrier protein] reductase